MKRFVWLAAAIFSSIGLLAFAGCGDGDGGTAGVDDFTGDWDCNLEEKITCGDNTQTNDQSGPVTIVEGTETDLEFEGEEGCQWGLNIDGQTARVPNDASCTFETSNGNTATLEPETCQYTLTDDTTMQVDCTAAASVETDDGTQSCDFEETGTCNK